MVERCVRDAEAASSSLVTSTNKMKIPFGIFILFIYICVRLELAACQKKLNLDISAVGLSYFIQDNRKEIPKRYLFSMVEVYGL